ncbi:MAG: hypothetical protein JSV18_01905 [Candidatus Bathyarchaeota archaeon]|nr:MAG: hypothetical protein JSV18_01905 [Candidatus Bathyarchaeota archaeon]
MCSFIRELAGDRRFRIVHIYGTHENTIIKYGIMSLLSENVEAPMSPSYPVCTIQIGVKALLIPCIGSSSSRSHLCPKT